jgi:hypothetical protein
VHRGFWWEDLREGGHLENLGLNGMIILNGSSKSELVGGHGVD